MRLRWKENHFTIIYWLHLVSWGMKNLTESPPVFKSSAPVYYQQGASGKTEAPRSEIHVRKQKGLSTYISVV